jgi:thymidylate synthase (FAD)
MNEVSRRYVDTPPEFYTPDMWRGRAVDKKQGSDGVVDLSRYYVKMGTTLNTDTEGTLKELVTGVTSLTSQLYDVMVANGVAPEQARMVLPLSMMTSWWWSGSLDAFANMCKLRLKEDTQYETRLVAQQISEYMSNLYPVSWGALINETD